MARIRRGAEFGTREARRRLRARPEPYWMPIDRGLSLGYRKSTEGGWLGDAPVHRARGSEARLAAQGNAHWDGRRQPRRRRCRRTRFWAGAAQAPGCSEQEVLDSSGQLYSVADAARLRRLAAIAPQERTDAESKLKTYVLPQLGEKRVADLKSSDFDAWLAWALCRRRKARKAKKGDAARSTHPLPSDAG